MSKIQGRLGKIQISTDGTNYTDINGLIDGTLNGSQAEIKITSHDDGQFETYLPGRKDFTVDGKFHYDEADAGQIALANIFYAGSTAFFKFMLQVGSGFKYALGSGFVTKQTPGNPNDDAATFDATIRLSGTVTWTNQ